MEHIVVATTRELGSKSMLKQYRREAHIPAVVYGDKKTPIHILLNEKKFRKDFIHISESMLITLKVQGQADKTVLIKDMDQDLIRERIKHIDFYEVSQGKQLTTNLLITTKGNSEGVRLGGILEQFMHDIEIECLPKDLPEELVLDISNLKIGDSLHVSELPTFPGVTYRVPEDAMVVHVSAPKQASLVPDVAEIEEEDEESDSE